MLIAYVFLITLSGPAANITENIGVLSASLSCGEVYHKIAFSSKGEITVGNRKTCSISISSNARVK